MEDLIRRSDAIKMVCLGCLEENKACKHHWDCPMLTNLGKVPSADTDISEYSDKLWKNAYERGKADRPQGEWKPFDLTWGRSIYACSACGESVEVPTCMNKPLFKFCPLCGAQMKGVGDERVR